MPLPLHLIKENVPDPAFRGKLIWMTLTGLILRLLWAAIAPVHPVSDSYAYDTFARNLMSYGVYGWTDAEPSAFWPPGTSFLYAAVYWAFGTGFSKIVILNLFLSCALIILSARVAARFYGNRVAIFAALLLAVWPTLVMFTTILASELPFLVLTIAALDIWTAPGRSRVIRGGLAGTVLGAAALVRPLALALPLIYGCSIYLSAIGSRRDWLDQLRVVIVSVSVMCCVIAPWTIRNYLLYGETVIISTNGGVTLWMGNSPGSNGGYADIPDRLSGLNDNEQSKLLEAEAKKYISDDPVGFAIRSLGKLVKLYSNESIGVIWNAEGIQSRFGSGAVNVLKRFTQLAWAAIFLLAVCGVLVLVRRRGWWQAALSPVGASIIYYSAVHSVVVSQDRYHLAFASQIAMLAGIGIAYFKDRTAT